MSSIAGEIAKWYSYYGNQLLRKLEIGLLQDPTITSFGNVPKECFILPERYLLNRVHFFSFLNNQKLDTTLSVNRCMEKIVVYLQNGL